MSKKQNISRRNFIKLSGMTGSVLALGYYLPASGKETVILTTEAASKLSISLNSFVSIDPDGKITLVCHRAEMGQGAFQSTAQIIAEELEVALDQVQIVFAPANPEKYGPQLTGGSSTVWRNYKPLSKVGASARQMLIEAAAIKWEVKNPEECYAENSHVIHRPSGRKYHYGQLVEKASTLTPPKEVMLKKPHEYKLLGKALPRQDIPLKINGTAVFGLDKTLPGMLYAVVERNNRFDGKLESFDDTETRKVPGVKDVFAVKMNVFAKMREGVAVVADNIWAAMQGRKLLKVTWNDSGFTHYSTDQLYARMKEDLKTKEGLLFKAKGNFTSAFEKAEKKIEMLYETPYQSHSCMEPINCVAHIHDGICEIWGPIQGPDWVRDQLSGQLSMPKEKIFVNMTFLGGGFGRKAFMDYPHEAALISKQMNAPVQVVWTREDDLTQGPFRPGMVYACKGGINKEGALVAFQMKGAGQNMGHQWPETSLESYNELITEGLLNPYYNNLPNYWFGDVPLQVPIPVMWWRSVYASTNGFALESFFDEAAHASGKDPMDFRRQYLEGARYEALIAKLSQVSGWKSRKKNEGYGVAITECFFSIVGEVVKVSKMGDGKIKIDKIWAVMDCGAYVNPNIIRAQVEGSIVMALGAATMHETVFKAGKAVQQNFHSYSMPRISHIPEIEVHIMDNEEKPGGAGEPALPPFAPALCNAIFDLTGKRIRKLPFDLQQV